MIERGKKVEVEVPLQFTGEAPAEKAGLTVVKVMHEVNISVRPSELPQHLEVELSALNVAGDHILAKDISLPSSADLMIEPDTIIVSVKEAVEEVEEVAPEADAAEAPTEEPKAE